MIAHEISGETSWSDDGVANYWRRWKEIRAHVMVLIGKSFGPWRMPIGVPLF
jgi:hypothetical protein